ncbi:hypothetical protein HDE_09936 [Halotydeus destructor]|nr:hypothetical protein HDE_09936 [Halotydeus destructor]
MNAFIILSALVAAASASIIVPSGQLISQGAYIPQSRFTRADWSIPTQVQIPAVAQYNVVRPAYTTLHQAAPLIARAPVLAYANTYNNVYQHAQVHAPVYAAAPATNWVSSSTSVVHAAPAVQAVQYVAAPAVQYAVAPAATIVAAPATKIVAAAPAAKILAAPALKSLVAPTGRFLAPAAAARLIAPAPIAAPVVAAAPLVNSGEISQEITQTIELNKKA